MIMSALSRIENRVMNEIDAFHDACDHCKAWATVSGVRKFVVRNNGYYFLADGADLRCYHRRDIYEKRASIVYIAAPA